MNFIIFIKKSRDEKRTFQSSKTKNETHVQFRDEKRTFQSLEIKNETHVQFRDENNTVWSVEDDGKLLGSLGAQG